MSEEDPISAAPDATTTPTPPTDMLYYEYDGNFLTECEAEVLSVSQPKEGSFNVILDRTLLHAQGGGQPTDKGRLVLLDDDSRVYAVDKVLLDRETGVATHTCRVEGDDTSPLLAIGQTVQVRVDEDHRRLLSECHTAGHVVDSAMARCGLHDMKPNKGYHFLDGPYVEYKGQIPPEQRPKVLADLQEAFCQLVDEQLETKIELLSKEEADSRCNRQAHNFDMDVFADSQTNQIRVVTVAGYPCPCGGTHVQSTADLKERQWGVTGLKAKKGVVRVKYGQQSSGSK